MYLEVLKQERKFGWPFWRLNDRKKGTTKDFSSYKLTSKLCLMYLEVKLQQDSIKNVFRGKKTPTLKVSLMLLDIKILK